MKTGNTEGRMKRCQNKVAWPCSQRGGQRGHELVHHPSSSESSENQHDRVPCLNKRATKFSPLLYTVTDSLKIK